MQTLYILQGVPGSGKSTVAKVLWRGTNNSLICSTDDYFMKDDEYKFDPSKLGEYHEANLNKAKFALDEGATVIVDNTNIKRVHCQPYVYYAFAKNIPVVFIRVTGNFQSIHGVPDNVIQRMKREMEDLTLESVLNS